MRVLVSGAAGFIGRHLVAHLSAEHEVVALVRPHHKTPPLPGLGEGTSALR
ncbi:MAG TPA: NAD-dependent epimerase/dehydratase family protein, partial [Chloroflexota bacterium]|nr:NAD-dependent epimerase/dehydratase family protein [Chloroflexota bacterium]